VNYLRPLGQDVVTVISYPLGAMSTEAKLLQMGQALSDGADKLDIMAFRSSDLAKVSDELKAVRALAGNHTLKLIYYSDVLAENDCLRAAD
jgi:deoxyribose-phosphate aldolase